MGVELTEPVINAASLAANMTNEGGVDGKFCFLKNIMGMWLLQECRRAWQQEGVDLGYDDRKLAECATTVGLLDPDHPDFSPLAIYPNGHRLSVPHCPALPGGAECCAAS